HRSSHYCCCAEKVTRGTRIRLDVVDIAVVPRRLRNAEVGNSIRVDINAEVLHHLHSHVHIRTRDELTVHVHIDRMARERRRHQYGAQELTTDVTSDKNHSAAKAFFRVNHNGRIIVPVLAVGIHLKFPECEKQILHWALSHASDSIQTITAAP